MTLPSRFTATGEAAMPDRWWRAFASPELNGLVEEALGSNLDLAVSFQRLQEARAVAARQSASLWPFLDAEAEGVARRPEPPDGDSLSLGLAAAYEVDLWGRLRSATEAERFRSEASLEDYQTVALSLSAEVTRTWLRLLTARQQRDLLLEQVESNEKVLELVRNRFTSGQVERVDILRQQQLLERTKGQLYEAESRQGTLEHQLAVLLGRSPQETILPQTESFPKLPALPETGLPGELVRQRPDIQAAYKRLLAADRDLASAVANRWPRISLSASAYTEDNDAVDLFDDWIRTLAANLVLPVIDGGERRAEVDRAEAVKLQFLYAYGQETIEALREVEDALLGERMQAQQLESLMEQARLASESLEQLRRQYINGISDYLDVLTTLIDEQQLRRDLLAARLVLYEIRISLYRALAGDIITGVPNLND